MTGRSYVPSSALPIRTLSIPIETRERLVKQIAKAFEGQKFRSKRIEEPIFFARKILTRCINGVTDDGKEWVGCPNKVEDDDMTLLRSRLRILGFDMDTGEKISGGRTNRKKRLQQQVAGIIAKENLDIVSPAAAKAGLYKQGSLLSGDEEREYNGFKKKLLKDFPGLRDTIVDELGIDQLALLHVEILRAQRLIATDKANKKINVDVSSMLKLYKETCESLGISQKQREAKKKSRDDGSVANLVMEYQEIWRDGTFLDLFREQLIEEFQMLYNKYRRGEIGEWYFQYMLGNYVEFPTGNIRPIDLEFVRTVLKEEGKLNGN